MGEKAGRYETNYRVPKKDMLVQIAEVLEVNVINFTGLTPDFSEDIIFTFSGWLKKTRDD